MHKPWYNFLYVRSPILKIVLGTGALVLTMALLFIQNQMEEPRMLAQTNNWAGRSVEKGAEIYTNNCRNCHGPDGKGLPGVAPALNSRYFFSNRLKDIGFAGSLRDYVALTVAAGRPNVAISQWAQRMPTWGSEYGGPLRNDQVEQVTQFILNWEGDALQQTAETDPWQPFQNAVTTGYTGTVEMAGAVSGEPRTPEVLFSATGMACAGCHNLAADQTPDNRGPVGPNLGNLDERAATAVPGEDAETYVHNSIVNPAAHVVEGYISGIMPANFADRMSDEEITALVQWILEQAAAN